jgi:hypothetical protein
MKLKELLIGQNKLFSVLKIKLERLQKKLERMQRGLSVLLNVMHIM